MEPTSQADQYKPKWRHFPPLSTVWVQNPFDHDVVFQVADELNKQWKYRLPAHKVSELPGGAIATLGVKEIVDELIQNNKEEALRIWDADLRAGHEEKVILRYKEAPSKSDATSPTGEIDLSVRDKDVPEADEGPAPAIQPKEFPDLDAEPVAYEPPEEDSPAPNPVLDQVVAGEADASLASLPSAAVLDDAGE